MLISLLASDGHSDHKVHSTVNTFLYQIYRITRWFINTKWSSRWKDLIAKNKIRKTDWGRQTEKETERETIAYKQMDDEKKIVNKITKPIVK